MMLRKLPAWIVLLMVANLTNAQQPEDVAKHLQVYYAKRQLPQWDQALKQLADEKPAQRAVAARYLVALLEQLQTDEFSGKAPWEATPFWGQSGSNPGREIRKRTASALVKAPFAEMLPVIKWYLEREKVAQFQEAVLEALDKIQGKEAEDFCLKLLSPPHENNVVVLAALRLIDQRKIKVPEDALQVLCDHHRARLRNAARKLNKDRGGPDPGPFDSVKAVQRPEVAALMARIGALLEEPLNDAPFVKVTSKYPNGTASDLGWLVQDRGNSWVVLTPLGQRKTIHKESRFKNRLSKKEWISTSSWEKYPIADEIKRVAAIRLKGNKDFELSARGPLTGQFQGSGAGLNEALLAFWAFSSKKFDLAAEILLPALDSLSMDRQLADMARQRLGQEAGYRMLVAFAGERDFAATQRQAKSIVQRYPNTLFHHLAGKLAKELPQRSDDFKQFQLPTPQAWATLKKKMSRTEQIVYLAERFRLLNCFQHGQPGSYLIREEQYAEPSGLSEDAAWGHSKGETRLINPYVELRGGREGEFSDNDTSSFKGLELTVADVPLLATFLRHDWHILSVSYFRDFHPNRHLGTTRPLFAEIINGLANRELVKPEAMDKMTNAEIGKQIESIVLWGNEHAKKSVQDLLWKGLEDEAAAGTKIGRLRNLTRLVELKDKRLVPVLLKYFKELEPKDIPPKATEQSIPIDWISFDLARLFDACLCDPPAFKERARKYIKHRDMKVRLSAARTLFAAREFEAAYPVFAEVLKHGDPWKVYDNDLSDLPKMLLKEGSEKSKQTARLIFKNPYYKKMDRFGVRPALVKRFAEAGIADGYVSYLALLDARGESLAYEIIHELAPNDPETMRIWKTFPRAEQMAPLKAWLKTKIKALKGAASIEMFEIGEGYKFFGSANWAVMDIISEAWHGFVARVSNARC